jgi:hypothetical protein
VCLFVCETEETPEEPVRNQLDGRAHAEGCVTVLRLRAGAPESSLSQHTLLQGQLATLKEVSDYVQA